MLHRQHCPNRDEMPGERRDVCPCMFFEINPPPGHDVLLTIGGPPVYVQRKERYEAPSMNIPFPFE